MSEVARKVANGDKTELPQANDDEDEDDEEEEIETAFSGGSGPVTPKPAQNATVEPS